MRLKLFYLKSVHDNAAYYYELAKGCRSKISGLEKAMEETEREIREAEKGETKEVRVKRQREWHESFRWAFTSGGRLMIGGRSAQQNDQAVAKRMEGSDLFFHADIQGGSAVILKGAVGQASPAAEGREPGTGGEAVAGEHEMLEAAQFAASYSNAWKNGNAAVDVYSVRKSQLTKHVSGGFVPAGAFAILGERTWFRNTRLALRVGIGEKGPEIVPDVSPRRLKDELVLVPSRAGREKGQLAKSLAKRFGVHPDELLELLPNGKSKTVDKNK